MRSKCQSIPGISTNDDLEHASGFGNLNIQFLQIFGFSRGELFLS